MALSGSGASSLTRRTRRAIPATARSCPKLRQTCVNIIPITSSSRPRCLLSLGTRSALSTKIRPRWISNKDLRHYCSAHPICFLQANTFQVVIASDGRASYLTLLYPRGRIEWIRGQGKNRNMPDALAQVTRTGTPSPWQNNRFYYKVLRCADSGRCCVWRGEKLPVAI